jgi:hypothetical protein
MKFSVMLPFQKGVPVLKSQILCKIFLFCKGLQLMINVSE